MQSVRGLEHTGEHCSAQVVFAKGCPPGEFKVTRMDMKEGKPGPTRASLKKRPLLEEGIF